MTRSRWITIVFGLAFVALCCGVRIADPPQLRLARELLFDQYQRTAPRAYQPMPVRIVDIDEASLAKFGQWPWSRDLLARMVDRLTELGAAAVAFDAVFPEPDRLSPASIGRRADVSRAIGPDLTRAIATRLPDSDAQFAAAIRDRNVVLGFGILPGANEQRPLQKSGLAYTGENPAGALIGFGAATANLPALDEAAAGLGAISVSPQDNQGIVRQVPLLWTDGKRNYAGLALEALRVAQRVPTILVRSTPTPPPAIMGVRIGDFEVPTTRQGELRIRFTPDVPERYLSVVKLLADPPDPSLRELVEDQVVLVGTSAVGLLDVRTTPLGETVPGVSVHAQAIEQILLGTHLQRPDWIDPLETLWTFLFGIAVIVIGVFGGALLALFTGAALALASMAGSWFAFDSLGMLVDPLFPAATALVLHFALTSFRYLVTDRDKRFVRRAFGRYVAPSVLAELERNPSALRLGGEERELTIMFLDVRSFTSLSETMTPTDLVDFVNRLLSALSLDVVAEKGTIDKFIGDSIMAFWNAPLAVPDHARLACRAALSMRERLAKLNEEDAFGFRARGDKTASVRIGIGLNFGLACVGNMGSESRFNYSALGDAVNVASRVEGLCKEVGADILGSDALVGQTRDLAWLQAGSVALRGRNAKTAVHLLVGDEHVAASESFAALKKAHSTLMDAWAHGEAETWPQALATCIRLAEIEYPMLLPFYRSPEPKLAPQRQPQPV